MCDNAAIKRCPAQYRKKKKKNNKMDRYLLPEPLPATGNLPEQWARFKKQFEQFLDASEKSGGSRDTAKIAILLRTIGDKGNDIYENFVF